MRPRPIVDLQTAMSPEEALARLREALDAPAAPVEGRVGRGELSLTVRPPARHLFSPWISLEVRPSSDGSRIHGRFGPKPELWTGFVFLYSVQLFVMGGGLLFGLAQRFVGDDPALALGAAALATLTQSLSCAVDLGGRARGRPQMETIRTFLEEAVDPLPCPEVPP